MSAIVTIRCKNKTGDTIKRLKEFIASGDVPSSVIDDWRALIKMSSTSDNGCVVTIEPSEYLLDLLGGVK